MKEAFEKILERFDAKKQYFQKFYEADGKTEEDEYINKATQLAFDDAKNIVQEVAEEYNGGWISCSERLPEIGQEIIVSTQNGSVYSNFYYDYTDSKDKEPCFHRWDDEMWDCFKPDVIAWQPFPEPFKERD